MTVRTACLLRLRARYCGAILDAALPLFLPNVTISFRKRWRVCLGLLAIVEKLLT